MRPLLPTLFLLLAVPASAQGRREFALTYDKIKAQSQSLDSESFDPRDNSGLGLAAAWSPWDLGKAQLGLTAGYRTRGSSDLVVSAPGFSDAVANYRYEHIAIGSRCLWRKPFDYGFGLQYRFEKLSYEPKGEGTAWSANQARPWVEGIVGYTFQSGTSWQPFVAFSLALPLTSASKPSDVAWTEAQAAANREQMVRSTAPSFEMALRVGIKL